MTDTPASGAGSAPARRFESSRPYSQNASSRPESTVRRRIAALRERGLLRTHVHVDVRRLGLAVDANLLMQVEPGRLDAVGRELAAHPAVHGAMATAGAANLHLAVWLPDLAALYRFLTQDIGAHGVTAVETVLVGRAVKRPGSHGGPA
ncbi:Lrp/AsnC family transcriptional regulator [Streptomyces sp. NPDC048473]|uniref:Lrp/AsnC family transcriptional regulator n=1 Tax=unclassified Streptomyces TaxID=2593676 RepID=UPI0037105D57